jgi:hypothetical protein
MALLDELREKKRLARMRLGQDAPDIINLKTVPGVRVALVPLNESEFSLALEAAASMSIADNAYGVELRDRMLQRFTLLYAVRDPGDPTKQVFSSVEELAEEFEPLEINHLMDCYGRMIEDSSPAIDGLTDEDMDTLKKALQTIEWSVLSGKPWWHLKSFLLTLTPEQLQVNSFGSALTSKLTGTSDEPESTPGVSES